MPEPVTKAALTPAKRQLIELLQTLNFGRLEELRIRHGEPVLEPRPRVVHEIKFGADNGPHAMRATEDFVLKAAVREFLAQLAVRPNGTIRWLEVRHGLPCRMAFEEVPA